MLCHGDHTPTLSLEKGLRSGGDGNRYLRAKCKNADQGVTRFGRVTASPFGIHSLTSCTAHKTNHSKSTIPDKYEFSTISEEIRPNFIRTTLRSGHPRAEDTRRCIVCVDCFRRSTGRILLPGASASPETLGCSSLQPISSTVASHADRHRFARIAVSRGGMTRDGVPK